MTKKKLYDPNEINSFAMQFGVTMAPKSKYPVNKKKINENIKTGKSKRAN